MTIPKKKSKAIKYYLVYRLQPEKRTLYKSDISYYTIFPYKATQVSISTDRYFNLTAVCRQPHHYTNLQCGNICFILTLSTLSNFNRLFHSLFWIKLKQAVGVKGLK